MYQDENNWRLEKIAWRNAAGCGTETAVQLRTSSGRCAETSQPELAPQSWPTRCTGSADGLDQRDDVGLELGHRVVPTPRRPGAGRVAALVRRVGAQPLRVQQRRDVAPAGAALGEPVQQHDRVAVERPLVADVEGEPVVAVAQQPGHRSGTPG